MEIVKDCGKTLERAREHFPKNTQNDIIMLRIREIANEAGKYCKSTPMGSVTHDVDNVDMQHDTWEIWPTQFSNEVTKLADEVALKNQGAICTGNDVIPSFSLGVSQIQPRNLCVELNKTTMPQLVNVTEDGNCHEGVLEKGKVVERNEAEGVVKRPRRDMRLSNNLRSPFVCRGIDINTRQVSAEEEAIWQWLFKDKRNKK